MANCNKKESPLQQHPRGGSPLEIHPVGDTGGWVEYCSPSHTAEQKLKQNHFLQPGMSDVFLVLTRM